MKRQITTREAAISAVQKIVEADGPIAVGRAIGTHRASKRPVSHATVYGWTAGISVPGAELRIAIRRWSRGRITVEAWDA